MGQFFVLENCCIRSIHGSLSSATPLLLVLHDDVDTCLASWLHQEMLAFTCTYSEMFGSSPQNILATGQASGRAPACCVNA